MHFRHLVATAVMAGLAFALTASGARAQIFAPNGALTFSPELTVVETDFQSAFDANPNGGTPATTGFANLALVANGGAAFESSRIAASYGDDKLNNGVYGNFGPDLDDPTRPWIAADADTNSFAGVQLLSGFNIEAIGFGSRFGNRTNGLFSLEYTTDSFAGVDLENPAQTGGLTWNTIGTLNSTAQPAEFGRHLVSFDEIVGVTGVRVGVTPGGRTITEIEVYEGFIAPPPPPTPAADTVVFETNSETNYALPAAFGSFATIPAPSASDYADQNSGNGVTVSVAAGSALALHPTDSGPAERLNDGSIIDSRIDCCNVDGNGPNGVVDAVFFDNINNTGRFLMSFPLAAVVESIATYAGIEACCQNRGEQNYTVWGSTLDNPDTAGTLADNGDWALIATVGGGPAFQTAAMISDSSGTIGTYKHLLFEVNSNGDGVHDFYGEIDVQAVPVPEPSTLLLALMSVVGLGFRRSASRRR